MSIGSDHACSGITDMAQEMFLLAGGYKETRINPRVMPPEHVVEMATINGAKGAGLGDRIGSVEVGKEADLVLFDTSWPDWQPLYNPVSNLVYAAIIFFGTGFGGIGPLMSLVVLAVLISATCD